MENIKETEKFFYAYLNNNKICTSVGEYPCKCEGEAYVRLDTADTAVLGCRYNNGVWDKADPLELITLEELKINKISEMSKACKSVIEKGIDIEIGGVQKHFSLSLEDQTNLNALTTQIVAGTLNAATGVPYHADGELCAIYSYNDFLKLTNAVIQFKEYHITYFNHLRDMINNMTDKKSVDKVTYGTKLEGAVLDSFNAIIGIAAGDNND